VAVRTKAKPKAKTKAKATRKKPPSKEVDVKKLVAKINQREVADFFGLSANAVAKWNCPRNKDGTYNLLKLVAWWRKKSEEEKRELRKTAQAQEGKIRLENAKAGKAELELQLAQNEVISRDQIHEVFAIAAQYIKKAGVVLGRKHGATAQKLLDEALEKAGQKILEGID